MTRAERLSNLSEDEKIAIVFGSVLYSELSNEGKQTITVEQFRELKNEHLQFIFAYIDSFDGMEMDIPSLCNLLEVISDREGRPKITEEETKRKYKELMERLGEPSEV